MEPTEADVNGVIMIAKFFTEADTSLAGAFGSPSSVAWLLVAADASSVELPPMGEIDGLSKSGQSRLN